MERDEYLQNIKQKYKSINYSECIKTISNKKKEFQTATLEGDDKYRENHKNGLKVEIMYLQNIYKVLLRSYNSIIYKIESQLFKKYKSMYKNIDVFDPKNELYVLYQSMKILHSNSQYDSHDSIISTRTISQTSKTYYEIVIRCLKKLVETRDIDDKDVNTYPDYNNPHFSSYVSNREEFSITIPKGKSSCQSNDYELAPYQIFLKNFISDSTPYNSIFIYHGTGTGKTCSAVSIAENYRDIYKNKQKRIIVLSSRNIKGGWYKNIYNPSKGTNQCTGDEYVKLAEKRPIKDDKQRDLLVNKYYEFSGYQKFANDIKRLVPYGKDKIRETYSNRLLIIDEVHNIRSETESKTENILKYIEYAIRYSDNLKLIIMSATPMYNKSTEIIWLLNMMLINDKKEPIDESDVFDSSQRLRNSGKRVLEKAMRGRVSYIRGETPDKFPIRLYPKDTMTYSTKKLDGTPFTSTDYKLTFLKLYGTELQGTQLKTYENELKHIIHTKIGDNPEMTDDIKISQISNISYPDDSNDIENKYGKKGLDNIFSIRNGEYSYKNPDLPILDSKHIKNYSSKFYDIIKNVKNSDGIVYIYSYWVEGTIIPLMLALEHEGYIHRSKKSFLNYDKKKKLTSHNTFIVLTSDTNLSKNNSDDVKALTNESNKYGEDVKIVIGSLISSEGIDMKYIREIHVVDPWHHLNRLEQIVGRGIRYCSHEGLEEIDGYSRKNVTIYLHVATLPDKRESIDELMYRRAEEKNVDIGEIETLLKINSIDCQLFKYLNVIGKNDVKSLRLISSQGIKIIEKPYDKPYSKVCSYRSKCDYICNGKTSKTLKKTMSTFNNRVGKNIYPIIQKYLKNLFTYKNMYTIEEITSNINQYITMSNDVIYLALDDMIKRNVKILNNNNISGYVIYNNKYYLFQPLHNNDQSISIYDRNSIQPPTQKHINLTIKKNKKKTVYKTPPKKIISIDKIKESIHKLINDTFDEGSKSFKANVKHNIDNYKFIMNDNEFKIKYVIDRLDLEERSELVKHTLVHSLDDEIDKIVRTMYQSNMIYKEGNKYIINKDTGNDPYGYILFDKIDIVAYTPDGKNEVLRDNVKKQIDINDYKDTKYGDILCYNSMGKLKIVTPLENTYREPIIMSSGYIKYGIVCQTTQQNNTSYKDFIKLINILNDSDINLIRGDIDTKKIKQKSMCILFEYLCRKHTNDTITYHIGQDFLYTYSKVLSLLT